jgi:hypothetical protein
MFKTFKIFLAIVVGVMIVIYSFNKYKEAYPEQFNDDNLDSFVSENPVPELTVSNDSSETDGQNDDALFAHSFESLTLRLEDPNEPPYGMFVGGYQNNSMLFRIDLPDNELLDSNDSLLQFILPVKNNTNLSERKFTISVHKGECSRGDEGLEWSKMTIGDIDFDKASYGDAGAGQRYSTYFYNWKRYDYCITFYLELKSTNASLTDPPMTEYDEAAEVAMMEKLLKSIKNVDNP